jgi:hypothetical protein
MTPAPYTETLTGPELEILGKALAFFVRRRDR